MYNITILYAKLFNKKKFYKIYKTTNELIFVGGIVSNLWLNNAKRLSRNFKQGYRVYSSEGIACSITTNGGGLGGCTGLYLIERENDE